MDTIQEVWDQTQPDSSSYKARSAGLRAALGLLEKDEFERIWQPDNWYRERGELSG